MDKKVRRSEAQNYDGERQMNLFRLQLSDIARKIMEADVDDDKIIKDKDESISINGQKYRPMKESKQRTFKEIYDRTFRSLK